MQADNEHLADISHLLDELATEHEGENFEPDCVVCQLVARVRAATYVPLADAARLDWIERRLFERKWSGTIGRTPEYFIRGDYRHTTQAMRGNTLREAVDAAIVAGTPAPANTPKLTHPQSVN